MMTTEEQSILEAIDEAFDALGTEAKSVVYYYFEKTCSLSKVEIPVKPSEFINFVRGMFGPGALILEENIIKSLQKRWTKYGLPYDFCEAVKLLKNRNGG